MFITPERKQQILDAAGSNTVDDDPMDTYRNGYEAFYPDVLKNKHIAEAYAAGMPVWQYEPAVSATAIAHEAALAWVVKVNTRIGRSYRDGADSMIKRRSLAERIKSGFGHSGPHIGVMRRWIQWKFRYSNGETVTWGSDEKLGNTELTAGDMDRLAERIKDAVIEDVLVMVEAQRRQDLDNNSIQQLIRYKGYEITDVGGGKWKTVFHNNHTGQSKVWIAKLEEIKAEIDRKASGKQIQPTR